MNSEGKIQRLPGLARDIKGRTGLRQLVSAQEDGTESAGEKSWATPTTTTTPTTPTAPPTAPTPTLLTTSKDDDEAIRKGDYKLYFYYLGSATATLLLLLFVSTTFAALSERIPGETHTQCSVSIGHVY